MIERVIENWLISASEKTFQIPFCQVLTHQGYTVVHMTRHCSMEMGKDIIAIAPDGTPTAFQLKATGNKKISKDDWRRELLPQIEELVTQSIDHPAIDSKKPHHPILVINGEIEEEAQNAIRQYNESLRRARKIPKVGRLEVKVRGQVLKMFLELDKNLLPSELKDEKSLLELYLMEGNEVFPKGKFAGILESLLPLTDSKTKGPAQVRAMTAAAIVTALALSSFSKESNHVAAFEAWTIFCCHILCLAEKRRLPKKQWEPVFRLGCQAIQESLEGLSDELSSTTRYVVGDPIADVPFYRIRITHLVGLMALLGLWSEDYGRDNENEKRFVSEHLSTMFLWGEYAVPQFLASYFLLSRFDATLKSAGLLGSILVGIAKLTNDGHARHGLPGPEVEPEEFVLDTLIRGESERKNTHHRGSFTIEGLLHLYVRHNLKQTMKTLWPSISMVQQKSFKPSDNADYYRWRVENGHEHSVFPRPMQSWAALRRDAEEHNGQDLPELIKKYPMFYLAFLIVCPHRFSASGVRWLDKTLQNRE